MNYIDSFRNPAVAAKFVQLIAEQGRLLAAQGRRVHIMEVCGSHTMAIGRYGIRPLLPANVELISGPGCPVCVTDPGYIDTAIELAGRGAIIATFGDMIRVPGSDSDLTACRTAGGDVRVCYSPSAAIDLARDNPDREVVFLAIGFETTTAPVVSIVDAALRDDGVKNLSLLTAFKLVPPALHALLADGEIKIDAFLCPAHVSAVIGSRAYEPIVNGYHVPCVVSGFEPLDILYGVHGILAQVLKHEASVLNQYARVVRPDGNPKAQARIEQYLEPVDAVWRGIGVIPSSGLGLRPAFAAYDAEQKFGLPVRRGRQHAGCRCGDVIKGKIRPTACGLFAKTCTPDHPVGPCMVSAEGTCAAYFKYNLPGERQGGCT
jgi:hydrogenase expression/formation protein HypD